MLEKLRVEDLPEDQREALTPVAERLNSQADALTKLLSRGGVALENTRMEMRSISFRTDDTDVLDTEWPPLKKQAFGLSGRPRIIVVDLENLTDEDAIINVPPFVQLRRASDGNFEIVNITGLELSTEYRITFLIIGG